MAVGTSTTGIRSKVLFDAQIAGKMGRSSPLKLTNFIRPWMLKYKEGSDSKPGTLISPTVRATPTSGSTFSDVSDRESILRGRPENDRPLQETDPGKSLRYQQDSSVKSPTVIGRSSTAMAPFAGR